MRLYYDRKEYIYDDIIFRNLYLDNIRLFSYFHPLNKFVVLKLYNDNDLMLFTKLVLESIYNNNRLLFINNEDGIIFDGFVQAFTNDHSFEFSARIDFINMVMVDNKNIFETNIIFDRVFMDKAITKSNREEMIII